MSTVQGYVIEVDNADGTFTVVVGRCDGKPGELEIKADIGFVPEGERHLVRVGAIFEMDCHRGIMTFHDGRITDEDRRRAREKASEQARLLRWAVEGGDETGGDETGEA